MSSSQSVSASLEDYLEAIYHLESEKRAARVKDIAKRLNINMSSVSGGLRTLARRKLINYTPYEMITLTAAGKKIARDVIQRHEVLRDFFIKVLSIEERLADQTACKMEHFVTPEILERFIKFIDFVENCPGGGAKWIHGFGYHCDYNKRSEVCRHCEELQQTGLKKGKIKNSRKGK